MNRKPSSNLYGKFMKNIILQKERILIMEAERFAIKLVGVLRELKNVEMIQTMLNIVTPRDISDLIETTKTFVETYGMSFGTISVQNADYDELVQNAQETIGIFLTETAPTTLIELKNIRDMVAKLDADGFLSTKDDNTSTNDFEPNKIPCAEGCSC